MDMMDQGYDRTRVDVAEHEVAEISRAESRLAEAIGSIVYQMDELQKRLERVLRPDEPYDVQASERLAEVRPPTTQMTDFLSAQSARLEAESVRITDILRRLGL